MTRRKGLYATLLAAALALCALAAPDAALADAVGIVSGGLVYDDVYGVVAGHALMAKDDGTVDVVNSSGTVTLHTDSSSNLRIDQYSFGIGNGVFIVTDGTTGKKGLYKSDGTLLLETSYDAISLDYESSGNATYAALASDDTVSLYSLSEEKVVDKKTANIDKGCNVSYVFLYAESGYLCVTYRKSDYSSSSTVYFTVTDGKIGEQQPEDYNPPHNSKKNTYTALDGTEFSVGYDAGMLTVSYGSVEAAIPGHCSYYDVYGSLIGVYNSTNGWKYYSYKGEEQTVFADFKVEAATKNGYIASKRDSSDNSCYILNASGSTLKTLESSSDGSYVWGIVTGSGETNHDGNTAYYLVKINLSNGDSDGSWQYTSLELYDVNGSNLNQTFTPSQGSSYNCWIYMCTPSLICVVWDNTFSYYNLSFEDVTASLGSGSSQTALTKTGTLPDGTVLYSLSSWPTGTVVDEHGDAVKLGAYTLLKPIQSAGLLSHNYNSGESLQRGKSDVYYAVDSDGNYGAVSSTGEVVVPFEFECIEDLGIEDESLILVKQNGLWYFYDTTEAAPTDPAGPTQPNGTAMYRLYNPNSGEHFYTASEVERDYLDGVGWNYEGIGWTAPASSGTPVYRLYNPNVSPKTGSGEHHYTTSAAERDSLVAAGWSYEGVGWYSDGAQTTPLYRLYNPNEFNNNHHYTTSAAERDHLLGLGWRDEGIAWYGVAAQ